MIILYYAFPFLFYIFLKMCFLRFLCMSTAFPLFPLLSLPPIPPVSLLFFKFMLFHFK